MIGKKLLGPGYANLEAQRAQQEELRKLPREERNQRVVRAMQDAGDVSPALRTVRHVLRFSTEYEAEGFRQLLPIEGYDLGRINEEKLESGDSAWYVWVNSIQAADIGSVERHQQKLTGLAAFMRGEYEGWEAEVVTREDLSRKGNIYGQ